MHDSLTSPNRIERLSKEIGFEPFCCRQKHVRIHREGCWVVKHMDDEVHVFSGFSPRTCIADDSELIAGALEPYFDRVWLAGHDRFLDSAWLSCVPRQKSFELYAAEAFSKLTRRQQAFTAGYQAVLRRHSQWISVHQRSGFFHISH